MRSTWTLRKIGRLRKKDIVDAFKIVAYEIRAKCKRYAAAGFSQADACQLALRIRDQRELIRQLINPRDSRHARRLLKLNACYRRDLLALVEKAGLDSNILVFK